ncbi:hypothetical protein SAMN05444339_1159 [Loktanella atrilutea]|uniref:VPLPA-CTERM protein sorting domain-containing protein n=1 Tax=Loktanella atrilutea TaxID=366533 RepID=A0A1M5EUV9_LOKAT|nr:VPLPA-CTERM sorting domain-containing protein [Loktanella atrilutea]SHF82987.1 hypothetical protein SAMN05444339_1159 [Loktanella atrilutea]
MDLRTLKGTAASAMLALTFFGATAVSAATTTCSTAVAATLSPNMGCEVSTSSNQDSVSPNKPLTVNLDGFFGSTDWSFLNKQEIGEESPAAQGGTLNISSTLWSTYGRILAIFKDGKDTFLTGFLLNTDGTTFTYTSPFLRTGKSPKDVSHISFYGQGTPDGDTGGPSPVPLPAGLPMLASALGLAVFLRKRRSA